MMRAAPGELNATRIWDLTPTAQGAILISGRRQRRRRPHVKYPFQSRYARPSVMGPVPFRRDFDAEAVALARGDRPKGIGTSGTVDAIHRGSTLRSAPIGAARTIVIYRQPKLLDALLKCACSIRPVGDDWHIEARSLAEQERIVDLLKLSKVHGVLRRKAAA